MACPLLSLVCFNKNVTFLRKVKVLLQPKSDFYVQFIFQKYMFILFAVSSSKSKFLREVWIF